MSALRVPGSISPELALVDAELRATACAGDDWAALGRPYDRPRLELVVVGAARSRIDRSVALSCVLVAVLSVLVLGAASDGVSVRRASEPLATETPRGTIDTEARTSSAPTPAAIRPSSQRFSWAPVAGAGGYHIELFREGVRVFAANTRTTGVTIPPRWRHQGRSESLMTGVYQWYVWPLWNGRRGQSAHVQSTVVVS